MQPQAPSQPVQESHVHGEIGDSPDSPVETGTVPNGTVMRDARPISCGTSTAVSTIHGIPWAPGRLFFTLRQCHSGQSPFRPCRSSPPTAVSRRRAGRRQRTKSEATARRNCSLRGVAKNSTNHVDFTTKMVIFTSIPCRFFPDPNGWAAFTQRTIAPCFLRVFHYASKGDTHPLANWNAPCDVENDR
jgi:hypothetical protein